MNWNVHSDLKGKHAFLGPSRVSWLNYDDEKLIFAYRNFDAAARGTKVHEVASRLIDIRQKLPKSRRSIRMLLTYAFGYDPSLTDEQIDNLYIYVNDGIGYRMDTEVILSYSPWAFGTSDAICFSDGVLRIHDLKTGTTQPHMEQLEIYAALFCLEYDVDPDDISIVLRIYQSGTIDEMQAAGDDVHPIMDKVVYFSDKLAEIETGIEVK